MCVCVQEYVIVNVGRSPEWSAEKGR